MFIQRGDALLARGPFQDFVNRVIIKRYLHHHYLGNKSGRNLLTEVLVLECVGITNSAEELGDTDNHIALCMDITLGKCIAARPIDKETLCEEGL